MTVSDFVNAAQAIADRIRYYKANSGGLTADGGCDCIGLVKEAYQLAGGRWQAGTGSNASARYMMQGLQDISAGALSEGMVVYKLRPPGDPRWKLPDTYRTDKDQNDYYHIGVVLAVKPLQILHCTTVEGGKKIDSAVGSWKKCGFLKGVTIPMTQSREGWTMVDYGREITSENGGNVNMRSGPGTNYSVLKSLKVGTEVEVRYEVDETWAQVYTGGTEGYVMRKFLAVPKRQEAAQAYAEPISAQGEIERVYSGLTENQGSGNVTELLNEIKETLGILISMIDARLHG